MVWKCQYQTVLKIHLNLFRGEIFVDNRNLVVLGRIWLKEMPENEAFLFWNVQIILSRIKSLRSVIWSLWLGQFIYAPTLTKERFEVYLQKSTCLISSRCREWRPWAAPCQKEEKLRPGNVGGLRNQYADVAVVDRPTQLIFICQQRMTKDNLLIL